MTLKRSTGFLNKLGGNKSNLISNGAFASDASDWTAQDATLSVVSGELQVAESGGANPGQAYQDIATVVGRIHKLTFKFKKGTADSGKVLVGTTADPDALLTSPAYSDVEATEKVLLFIATEATTRITLQSDDATDGETSFFDDVAVEEIVDGYQEIFRNCKINVYTGAQPASADDAATGTLLYTLTVDGDGVTGLTWGEAVAGVVSKAAGEAWQGTAVATGTAGWFRVYEDGDDPSQSTTDKARWDGAIAVSGAEANMTNTSVETGAIQSCSSFTYTQPAS